MGVALGHGPSRLAHRVLGHVAQYLGLPFDIHGGGADLVFPHHENERAQSEAACGCTFANYWMHGGMLQINSEKMSKSLGNFKLLRDVLKVTDPKVLRFLMLQTHYRSPLDFSDERLAEAGAALCRIENAVKNLDWQLQNAQDIPSPLDTRELMKRTKEAKLAFILAMDDDFNTCKALGEVFDFVAAVNAQTADRTISLSDVPPVRDARGVIVELMGVFGIDVEAAIRLVRRRRVPARGRGVGGRYRGSTKARMPPRPWTPCWRPVPTPAPRRIGAVPTPSATACAVWAS